MLGGLGRDKDFICRNKAPLGPMLLLWTVLRQGVVNAGWPCVAIGWRNGRAPVRPTAHAIGA